MKLLILDVSTMLPSLLLIAGAAGASLLKKLSFYGALTAAVTGILVFEGAGFTGIAMLIVFFVTGTAATSFRRSEKKQINIRLEQKRGRTAGQVLANGGIAGLMGLLAIIDTAHTSLYLIMLAASLASASSDTLSSELGTLYGKNFYNILSFRRDLRGQDGVISLEGTLIGIAGSALIGFTYYWFLGWSLSILSIVLAGIAGNLADSVLGASLERKGLLKNNMVNFLSTLIAAGLAGSVYIFNII